MERKIQYLGAMLSKLLVTRTIVLLCLLTLGVGCASTKTINDPLSTGLLLAEPEMLSTRAQLSVSHYTSSLYQLELTKQERAELLFQRGIAFDSLGLVSLARKDYAEALTLKPAFADAHNSLGVLFIQAGMHMLAYEAFDSTLEINPSYDFALLNRGVALYYGGRADLGEQDTAQYLQLAPEDPFRLLWHYIVSRGNNSQERSQNMLREARVKLSDDNWAITLVDYYLGVTSESAVVANLIKDVTSQSQLNHRLCEAYFYLGKYSALKGNYIKAENYFKLALSTNVYEYVEHKYARIELSNLRQTRLDEMQAQ